ncbi:hypothetical protein ACJX0J_034413, partial [Zea mays]
MFASNLVNRFTFDHLHNREIYNSKEKLIIITISSYPKCPFLLYSLLYQIHNSCKLGISLVPSIKSSDSLLLFLQEDYSIKENKKIWRRRSRMATSPTELRRAPQYSDIDIYVPSTIWNGIRIIGNRSFSNYTY